MKTQFHSHAHAKHYDRNARKLAQSLPNWHFEPYGIMGAVACYPPNGTNAEAFRALKQFAFISSVCGPLYVVSNLK